MPSDDDAMEADGNDPPVAVAATPGNAAQGAATADAGPQRPKKKGEGGKGGEREEDEGCHRQEAQRRPRLGGGGAADADL